MASIDARPRTSHRCNVRGVLIGLTVLVFVAAGMAWPDDAGAPSAPEQQIGASAN